MNLVSRVIHLYEWKEEIAHKLGNDLSNEEMTMFKEFDWWFDSISFDRIEPQFADIVKWERRFAEV